jgi:hypothetical protein
MYLAKICLLRVKIYTNLVVTNHLRMFELSVKKQFDLSLLSIKML